MINDRTETILVKADYLQKMINKKPFRKFNKEIRLKIEKNLEEFVERIIYTGRLDLILKCLKCGKLTKLINCFPVRWEQDEEKVILKGEKKECTS